MKQILEMNELCFFLKYDEWVNSIDNFYHLIFIPFITAFVVFF